MPETNVAVTAENNGEAIAQQQPQQQRQSGWQIFQSMLSRMFFFYLIMQTMNYFKGANNNNANNRSSSLNANFAELGNLIAKGSKLDLYVYISNLEDFDFSTMNRSLIEKSLFYSHSNIEYGDWSFGEQKDGILTYSSRFELDKQMQSNSSIYMHVIFTEHGHSPNPNDKDLYSNQKTFSSSKRLNRYMKKTYKSTKNLLTGSSEKNEEYQAKAKENLVEVLSYWHPNITINLVDDHTPWQPRSVPPPLNDYIVFDEKSGKYYPIVFINDYWNLRSDYYPINDTLSHLNLTITFSHLQLWKWQMYLSQQMRNNWYTNILSDEDSQNDDDQDTLKKTLMDTNPYILALTAFVTVVHSVFEFLAFKNDIQFWKNKKSLEGLSVNSVLFGCFTSFVVLLYVLDNETNTMVKVSVFIGLLIDLWKIPKAMSFRLNYERKCLLGLLPQVEVIYKSSYVETNTNDYDRLAFKYLSWILFPLVIGYAIYSVLYLEHKGWYSFILSTMYGFILTFGFIMMTPQLFINYKLKSVAHLPWRMMTYKALNTFIDDIFAFVIQMPTLYRLGCFRDDIIFFIYLYQKWIYPVDKKRTNEFGTSGEEHHQQEKQEEQQQSVDGQKTEKQREKEINKNAAAETHLKSE